MKFSKIDYSATKIKEYVLHACRYDRKAKQLVQPVFKSTVFARNEVFARSRLSKILEKQYKVKRSECVVLKIEEVEKDNDFKLKNYGIKFVYGTRNGSQHGYKECRHINRVLAVSDLYRDFGNRHKIAEGDISVYEIKELKDDEVKKARILAYTGEDVEFPVFKHVPNTNMEYVPHTVDIFN